VGSAQASARAAVVSGASGLVGRAVVARLEAAGFQVGMLQDADLDDRRRTVGAVQRIASEIGPISVLVTSPELHDAARFGELDADRWHRLLNAHLGTTTNACAATVPGMVERGHGRVITISSWLAFAGVPGEAYFAAAAGSILAFTKSFALEVAAHGVRVNCIAAGPTEKGVTAADVADTVMFLVDDGDFFVGQVLTPAGGAVV